MKSEARSWSSAFEPETSCPARAAERPSPRARWRAAVLRLAAALPVAVLAACAGVGPGGTSGPPIPAPTLHVGDRWVYHAEDGFRVKTVWEETHEIVAMGADGITVRVTQKGATVDSTRTEKWSAPGIVLQGAVYDDETRRFDPPLIRFQYPLTPGERWNQRTRDLDQPPGPYGPITRTVTVGGFEQVTTPAGTFNALRMRVIMQLDDETFWRFPTQANYEWWYAPEVGALVRQDKRSSWRDKGSQDATAWHPGQNATIELVSYRRGG